MPASTAAPDARKRTVAASASVTDRRRASPGSPRRSAGQECLGSKRRFRLLGQAAQIIAALPQIAISPLVRPWHLRWGATDDEVASAMPGDGLVPKSHFTATRAITIDAPPEAVWPWVMQVGFNRTGFYSFDLLDSLGRPSSNTILADWQQLRVVTPRHP
jgi:hypothetical protein